MTLKHVLTLCFVKLFHVHLWGGLSVVWGFLGCAVLPAAHQQTPSLRPGELGAHAGDVPLPLLVSSEGPGLHGR